MKTLSIVMMSLMFTSYPTEFVSVNDQTVVRGDMRLDKIVDYSNGVTCYLAQHNNGSSHTTPNLFCFKKQ